MKNVTIDCTGISTKDQLFDVFSEKLSFPDYFGRNWDALNDCLWDIAFYGSAEVSLRVENANSLPVDIRETLINIIIAQSFGKLKASLIF